MPYKVSRLFVYIVSFAAFENQHFEETKNILKLSCKIVLFVNLLLSLLKTF
jgi:hypothetical protein